MLTTEEKNNATISSLLGQDHRRLRAAWNGFVKGVEQRDIEAARSNFAVFDTGLRRHIRVEEGSLFPAFEEATGMHSGGPTFVMRSEHRQVEAILARLADELSRADFDAIGRTLSETRPAELYENHDAKEEGMLYPMADRAISGESRAVVMAAIVALSE